MSELTSRALRFEPHNGYGGNDFHGEPWPFGYISDAQPIFELNVITERERAELTALARQMAAAPAMLAALKEIIANNRLMEKPEWWDRVLAIVAKVEADHE